MGAIIDMLRRARIKRGPMYIYQTFGSFSRTVGVNVVSLSPSGSLVCSVVIVQTSLANTDIVYLGGAGLSSENGLELTAGQAILLTSSVPNAMDQKRLFGGLGIMPWLQYMEPLEARRQIESVMDQRSARIVIDLNQIFVVAANGNQTLRVFYTQEPTVD